MDGTDQGFAGDVMAGCDIERNGKLYRQVEVVLGPGRTMAELRVEALEKALLAARIHVEAIHAGKGYSDQDIARTPAGSSLGNYRDALAIIDAALALPSAIRCTCDAIGEGACPEHGEAMKAQDVRIEHVDRLHQRIDDLWAVAQAAEELLKVVGERSADGDFVPLPQSPLTGAVREDIAPWVYRPWATTKAALHRAETRDSTQ